MAKPILTAARLRELLHYEPETGVFTWTQNRWRVLAGDVAGGLGVQGYVVVTIERCTYRAHRLAWLWVHGEWPKADIDHINGVRNDNRIANLRDVDRGTNLQNQRRPYATNRTSGLLGVCYLVRDKRWVAQISCNGVRQKIGYFSTAEEAHTAYLEAKRRLHPGCTI